MADALRTIGYVPPYAFRLGELFDRDGECGPLMAVRVQLSRNRVNGGLFRQGGPIG